MDKPKFKIGSNVFAKMKGFPPWPAIIEGIHDLTPKKIKYSVYFYGTRQVGVIKEGDVFSFSENKEKLGKPRKNASFNLSMAEAEANIFTEGSTQYLLATLEEEAAANGSQHSENSASSSQLDSDNEPEESAVESDLADKVTASLIKEKNLISQTLDIQSCLGVDKADFEQCLNILQEMEDSEIIGSNKIVMLKNPDVVLTLLRVKNYHPTHRVLKTSHSKSKKKLPHIRKKATRILEKLHPLFPTKNGQSFVQAFQEELKQFKDITKNFNEEEVTTLTEEFLIACCSSQDNN